MTPKVLYVEGLDQILRNVRKANDKIGLMAERGLLEGGKFLREESEKIVPVRTGKLKSSCYGPKNIGEKGLKADVVIGYAAEYAVCVHENPSAAHGKEFNVKYAASIGAGKEMVRKEEEQWKFLETPMRVHRNTIFKIIANWIRKAK